jgi:hypothetical protein
MGVTVIHHSKKGWQSMLDQQLTPTKQSHSMQAISVADYHPYLMQAFWVHFFHKTGC